MTALLNITQEHVFVEGDYKVFTVTFTNKSDGELYDFTGVTMAKLTIKKNQTDAFDDALVKLNSDDNPTQVEYGTGGPGAGIFRVKFESADTVTLATQGPCWFDIRVIKNGKPQTLGRGPWTAFTHVISDDMT